MHFHLPKPLHGWREFVGEVGIIVLGVLIALAAEQAVENLSWRHKVAVVRRSLVGELGNDRARWEVDVSRLPCFIESIGKLDDWAKNDGKGDANDAASLIGNGTLFWMHSANWQLATGGGTLDHFPIDQQLAFAALYDGLAHREVDIEKASDLFERAGSLISVANSPDRRQDLRAALSSLRNRLLRLNENDNYMRRHFEAVGVKADNSDFAVEAAEPLSCQALVVLARDRNTVSTAVSEHRL